MRYASLGIVLAALLMPAQAAVVPFVGCPSGGQVGAESALKGQPATVIGLDDKLAARLAFYRSKYDEGVLAPRGWHCANLEGSNGWILIVVPEPVNPAELTEAKAHFLKGPAIQLTEREGGTSGRFEVARLIARYFPTHREFLQSVIAETIEPVSAFPAGPYPADHVMVQKKDYVEVLTPAHAEGLGTRFRLRPSDQPIRTAAFLTGHQGDLQAFILAVRLPDAPLANAIIGWVKRHYTHHS